MQWKNIKSAPKDGSMILAANHEWVKILWRESQGNKNDTGRAGWIDGTWDWRGDESNFTFEPTHWMPLPKQPTPANVGGK